MCIYICTYIYIYVYRYIINMADTPHHILKPGIINLEYMDSTELY